MAKKFDVAVMHDYFVDRLVHTPTLGGLVRSVSAKAAQGGGGIHGVSQEEVRGGNAVNLAHALARLGLRTLLITHSGPAHEHLLRQTFSGLKAEVRVKPLPAGLTVAFESRVNVMLGDVGGAGEFGPSLLDDEDWDSLDGSKVVCSVNWAANRQGTRLLAALRRRLGPTKAIFRDPADFRDRVPLFGGLLRRTAREHLVDWVSMNEFEGRAAAGVLGVGSSDLGKMTMEVAKLLGVVFDLHAVRMSYSSEGTRVASAKVNTTTPKRLTGAGDVWDAGAIYGRLKGLDEQRRLALANRAARLYLESEDSLPPTADELAGAGS